MSDEEDRANELIRLDGIRKRSLLSMAQVDWLFEHIAYLAGQLNKSHEMYDEELRLPIEKRQWSMFVTAACKLVDGFKGDGDTIAEIIVALGSLQPPETDWVTVYDWEENRLRAERDLLQKKFDFAREGLRSNDERHLADLAEIASLRENCVTKMQADADLDQAVAHATTSLENDLDEARRAANHWWHACRELNDETQAPLPYPENEKAV